MFDFKKTIILSLVVMAVVLTAVAGYTVGRHVGYSEGFNDACNSQYERLISQDSLLRKQTELSQRLMDKLYEDKFNIQ